MKSIRKKDGLTAVVEAIEGRRLLSAAPVTITIGATTGPWTPTTGNDYGVHDQSSIGVVSDTSDNTASGAFPIVSGQTISINYTSGTVSPGGGYPAEDANGNTAAPENDGTGYSGTYFPSKYISSSDYPVNLAELVGVFTDGSGTFVGTPFAVGDSKTLKVPDGASQLQLGVNDDIFSDNGGSWNIQVSTGAAPTTNSAPLVVAIDQSKIAPTQQPTLNLDEIYGTENVNVPFFFTNTTNSAITQKYHLVLIASPDGKLSNGTYSGENISSTIQNLSVPSNSSITAQIKITIKSSLIAGQSYHIAAELFPANEDIVDAYKKGLLTSDVTPNTLEYVGAPLASESEIFSSGDYLQYIADLANGHLAYDSKATTSGPAPDGYSFTGPWEIEPTSTYPMADLTPYLDSAHVPTIGVGQNLRSVPSSLVLEVANIFQSYYVDNDPSNKIATIDITGTSKAYNALKTAKQKANFIFKNEEKIISIVADEPESGTAVQSLTQEDAIQIYYDRYNITRDQVIAEFGAAAQDSDMDIALNDIQYNIDIKTKNSRLYDALQKGDYLEAGFDMVNWIRSVQVHYGPNSRVEAEFQEFFDNSVSALLLSN